MKSWIAELVDEELYSQQHLHETSEQFVERVCMLCLDEIEINKGFAPTGFGEDVVNEIELEVTEVLKIKTYGFYSLQEYRKSQLRKRIS